MNNDGMIMGNTSVTRALDGVIVDISNVGVESGGWVSKRCSREAIRHVIAIVLLYSSRDVAYAANMLRQARQDMSSTTSPNFRLRSCSHKSGRSSIFTTSTQSTNKGRRQSSMPNLMCSNTTPTLKCPTPLSNSVPPPLPHLPIIQRHRLTLLPPPLPRPPLLPQPQIHPQINLRLVEIILGRFRAVEPYQAAIIVDVLLLLCPSIESGKVVRF